VVKIQDIDYAWIYHTRVGAPVSLSFTDGSVLLGYSTSAVNLRPGQPLQLNLFWREPSTLRAVEGKLASAHYQGAPSPGANLTTGGTASDLARVVLNTPSDMPVGEYVLSMRVLYANRQPIQGDESDGDGWVKLRSVEVRSDRR
jgi:hypothetical protein